MKSRSNALDMPKKLAHEASNDTIYMTMTMADYDDGGRQAPPVQAREA